MRRVIVTQHQDSRVLIVEDDYFLAEEITQTLNQAGLTVIESVGNAVAAAASLQRERADVAIVDLNLGDGISLEVAQTLSDAGIPFVFVTGYDRQVLNSAFDTVPMLQKPVDETRLLDAIVSLLDGASCPLTDPDSGVVRETR